MRKSEAERAAEATRKAIARITAPKRRRASQFKILGETGPRDSMFLDDEYASTNPVIFDKRSGEWRKADGKWVQR